MSLLRTRPASHEAEYLEARKKFGAVYLIRGDRAESLKIGHSFDPTRRLAQLRTGSSAALRLVAVVAGSVEVEKCLHRNWMEYHSHLEWFHDPQSEVSEQILRMIHTEPFGLDVWEIVPGKWVFKDSHPDRPGWSSLDYVPA